MHGLMPASFIVPSAAAATKTTHRLPFAVRILLFVVVCVGCTVRAELVPVEEPSRSGEVDETVLKDFMICRLCGHDISLSNFLLAKPSAAATLTANATLYGASGVLVQDLVNPQGGRFRVVALRKAQCAKVESWRHSHMWYPGYAWKVCLCPKCSVHLGWMFEPFETATAALQFPTDGRGFYLLIVQNVLSETYVNSLIATDWDKTPSTTSTQTVN